MLRPALKHEKEKGSHSVVKEARKFAREIDLVLETEFDGEMKNTKDVQKMFKSSKELLRKKERRLSILPLSQNLYMVNTPSEAKKLM